MDSLIKMAALIIKKFKEHYDVGIGKASVSKNSNSVYFLDTANFSINGFLLSQESLFQTRKGIEYTMEEIDSSPSELRTRKFTRTTIPTLKKDKTQRPIVPLPSKISDQLDFSVVKIRGFGKGVLLSGQIADGDALKFVEFIKNTKGLPLEFVALHSPGGSVMEAMIIGEEIRERALKTMLPGHSYCYSACPYIMAGGIERFSVRTLFLGYINTFSRQYVDTSLFRSSKCSIRSS